MFKEIREDWGLIKNIAPAAMLGIKVSAVSALANAAAAAVSVGVCLMSKGSGEPEAAAVCAACFSFAAAGSYVCLRGYANHAQKRVLAHNFNCYHP